VYRHCRHVDQLHYLFHRVGKPIRDPSPVYSAPANWTVIEKLKTPEDIPEQYRTTVLVAGSCIYARLVADRCGNMR
jgi:hypothetical protein